MLTKLLKQNLRILMLFLLLGAVLVPTAIYADDETTETEDPEDTETDDDGTSSHWYISQYYSTVTSNESSWSDRVKTIKQPLNR